MLRLVFISMFMLAIAASGASAARAETQIVTTILPLEGLVRAVGGTHISVETLGDGRTSPHDLRLTPTDRQRLNQADLVLMVDPSLEPFMTRLIPQLKQVLVLSKLNGLTLLETEEEHHHGHHDEHEEHHDDEHHNEHDDHHDAHHDEHDEHDADKFLDPHLWLDPHNSITIAMELAHVLGKIAPAHADAFTANAKTLAGQLRALDRTLTKKLAAATKGKKYVLFHDAFSYFTAHYQIDIPAVVASETHGGMGVHELNDLRTILASGDIACLFTEPQFSAPIVAQLANDYAIAVGVMDPLGSQLPRDARHPLALYESIAQAFITCEE